MGQKLVVPLAALVLVLGAAVAAWLLWPSDGPRPTPPPGNDANARAPGNAAPLRLNPADFDPARVEPDPVTTQRPPQPYTPPAKALRIIVSGRVVNDSGVGIADACVSFSGDQQLRDMRGTGYSDAAGNYRLLAWSSAAGLPTGERLGRVAAETPDGGIAVGEMVTIAEDAAEMPELVIQQAAVLEGQVLAEDGAAVPGAKVTLRSGGPVQVVSLRGRAPEIARRQLVRTVFADETGRFRFQQLPSAAYSMHAEGEYFGANRELNPVDLTLTSYGWAELRLKNENHIRGVLQDQAGQPVPGAVVQLIVTSKPVPGERPAGNAPVLTRSDLTTREDRVRRFDETSGVRPLGGNRVVTDAAGRFGFQYLVDLEYTIATKLGEAEARHEGAKINQPDYTLNIQVNTSLSGVVRDAETGRAIEGFDVRVMRMSGEPQVTPFDRVAPDGLFQHHPGGAWLLANPPLQDAVVRISAPGYAPAVIKVGELREGDQRRDLDASLQPLCSLTFELVHEGRKLDLEPVAMLFDERLAFEASSDELGRVRIPDVPPAVYKVKVQLADGSVLEGSLAVPARREAALTLQLAPAG